MAYPQTYDNLGTIDLASCAVFTHVLTDGIIDTADEIEMNAKYFIFARYGAGIPVITIVDPILDEFLIENVAGVYQEKTGLYKFEIDVPADQTIIGSTMWRESKVILKLHSADSQIEFTKHVAVVLKACTAADMCNMLTNTIEAIGQVAATEEKQTEQIIELQNGWRAIY